MFLVVPNKYDFDWMMNDFEVLIMEIIQCSASKVFGILNILPKHKKKTQKYPKIQNKKKEFKK